MELTKKSRTEALRMANAIKAKNPDLKPYDVLRIVESKIGKLYWSSEEASFGEVVPEGQGEEFYLKSTGKGTLNARPRSEKRNRRGRNESTRQFNIRISTPQNVNKRGASAKANRIRAQGLQVDHINEVSRTGPALALMTPSEQARYLLRLTTGDQAGNYQGLSQADNGQKNRDLRKLDKHLGAMEAKNPSPTLQKLDARSPILGQVARRLGMFSVPNFTGSNTALETHPLGGSVVQTDPGGTSLSMRIP